MKDFRQKFKLENNAQKFSVHMPSTTIRQFAEDAEGVTWVEMVKKGTYYYYGDVIEIGTEQLEKAIVNFNSGLTNNGIKKDLLFDYDHDWQSTKAAGWITAMKLSEDGITLLGKVDWSKAGKDSIDNDEYRYTSLEFSEFFYVSEMIGDEQVEINKGFTVFACTLTNTPFVKGMEAVTLSENNEPKTDNINKTSNTPQSGGGSMEYKEKHEKLTVEFSEISKTLTSANTEIETLKNENKELNEKIAFSAKNAEFDSMLSDNTAVEAQREHFLSGDMVKFAKAFSALPMNEVGTSEANETVKSDDLSIRTEEIAKEQNISFSDASRMAMKEIEGVK